MTSASNFSFLEYHDALLFKLAETAESCFVPDPNITLVKMRQLGEALAQNIAARIGIEHGAAIKQVDLLREIDYTLRLDPKIKDAFHTIRQRGNHATHQFDTSTHRDALAVLQIGWALSCWFHNTFAGDKAKNFKPGKFVKPKDPSAELRELEERIRLMLAEQNRSSERIKVAEALRHAESEKLKAEQQRATLMAEERSVWETIAEEQERELDKLKQHHVRANNRLATNFTTLPKEAKAKTIEAIEKSVFDMNEAETRLLIDAQLRERDWIVDSENLTYGKGARPEKGRAKAIAEWPTKAGPADYLLFNGLTAVAVIEAKKAAKNVYSAIDQAKRYAANLKESGDFEITTTWGEYKVPVVFATNGRPYLKQLKHESGIWFLDVRDKCNQREVMPGWYTPKDLSNYLNKNIPVANSRLDNMSFQFEFSLRPYQIDAIKAVEQAIKKGQREMLVAMATGTGKTKTCIALVYRLLKSGRFRRILFLVDRSALGEQAANAFNETRMEPMQTFADRFGVKELSDKSPDDDTKVHIATIQGMVKRIMYAEGSEQPSVGQYDCIVVDECHRGYLLDRELSDTELQFRDQNDYISKYRTVIEYFSAIKVGLTATPALHTSEIFGDPVYAYTYPEAVVDGFLADHLPPLRIVTQLSRDGIKYKVNEEVAVYQPAENQIELFRTPDEMNFEVAHFNKQVESENFNRAVVEHLITKDYINPYQPAKTLVFCATDRHADIVVQLFKEVCAEYHGEIEDDAIQKITGQSDKPLEKIRHYKNDRLPNIAVTVDLLTTGIDVPAISNLVFMRRVNSRILFEQMLGRATRRCDEIGKEWFRIFDAVDIYSKLEKVNTMKPVAADPNITFSKLTDELTHHDKPELQELAKKQFMAKLQSKRRHLTPEKLDQFETIVGQSPEAFLNQLKNMTLPAVAEWFTTHQGLGELLDSKLGAGRRSIVISDHDDEVIDEIEGYGEGNTKPEDYLEAFRQFINAQSNRLPALSLVVTRPWELSRKELKAIVVELDRNHFREQEIKAAWHKAKNEEIAARIIGFIRQAAIGEALIPWDQRVDNALATILALKAWSKPQRDWLETIAKQAKTEIIVDMAALDNGVFKDMGRIRRAQKLFDGQIGELLQQFNQALWKTGSR